MIKLKFTEGPWNVSENQPTVVGNKEKAVCKCELDWNLGTEERKANAALISAAPEMYDIIVKLRRFLAHGNGGPLSRELDKLLAKARGER